MTQETDDLERSLDSREFYELMQRYRWARVDGAEGDIIPAFEAVKTYIRGLVHPLTDGHGNDITHLAQPSDPKPP